MVDTVYDNVSENAQATVYSILSSDATVSSLAARILDGSATDVIQRFSTFVLVHTPSVVESNSGCGGFRRLRVSCDIDCVSGKESLVRQLFDSVRSALEKNLVTLNGVQLRRKIVSGSFVGAFSRPGTSLVKGVSHLVTVTVEFDWFGVGS